MVHALTVSVVALERLDPTVNAWEGVEAFGLVVRIADAFTRLVNNFKTALMGFRRNFKRSELKAYHDSHALAFRQFTTTRWFDPALSVPIPAGMKVSYLQATTALESLHGTLDIGATVAALAEYFGSVDKAGVLPPPAAVTRSVARLTMEKVEHALRGVFTSDRTLEVTLGSVVGSFDEILEVDKHILAYEQIFQKVDGICAELEHIEQAIDRLVTSLETSPTIDKGAVQGLYDLVRAASVQLDIYGVLLNECQRVEHNFVILLRRVVDASRR